MQNQYKRIFLSFIFSFFVLSSVDAMQNTEVYTTQYIARYFIERGLSRGLVIVSSTVCPPCNHYERVVEEYLTYNPHKRNSILKVKITPETMQSYRTIPDSVMNAFKITSVPSTFIVKVQNHTVQVDQTIPSVMSVNEFSAMMNRTGL